MAGNKFDVQFGGGFSYGWQPGMTNDADDLTVLRYTNPKAAEAACAATTRAKWNFRQFGKYGIGTGGWT